MMTQEATIKVRKKYNYNLIIGCVISGLMFLMVLVGHFWTPYGENEYNSAAKLMAPCLEHLMGTDKLGRDVFSRVMIGAGDTYVVALVTVLIGVVFGTLVGALTGYFGGWFDEVIMRINDVILSFPSVLLALIFVSLFGGGQYNIILALGILFIPSFARIVRSEMIRCKELEYVKSAKVQGAGCLRIIFVHILPNTKISMLTAAMIGFNNAVLAEASMSYLGLGVQPPDASLGLMLYDAQSYLYNAPWYAISTGIVMILIILGFSMIGEGLRKINA